jgi:hypothetical protein
MKGAESTSHMGLIINADDWGRDQVTTDCTLECFRKRTISSVSAMVFMEDSERACEIAQELSIDTGLHLNLTQPFTSPAAPSKLIEHHQRIHSYLQLRRYSQVVFHPGLAASFEYVVAAQIEEFARLYGRPADRIDGHHHMHLCANVLLGRLLPAGTIVRRNFSFWRGEKSRTNILYRRIVDSMLARRHRLVDFFFSLPPVNPPGELQKVLSLARHSAVELAAHPVDVGEYRFLTQDEIHRLTADCPIAQRYAA